jgi:hexosaminidase
MVFHIINTKFVNVNIMKGSHKRLLLLILICFNFGLSRANLLDVHIVPTPDRIEVDKGFCSSNMYSPFIKGKILPYSQWLQKINASEDIKYEAKATADGFTDFNNPAMQHYRIDITNSSIKVQGFMGYQTLYQLYEQFGEKLLCMVIEDTFNYKYRGMHLDVCRHFFTVQEVKKYLDLLARYRYNVFHWHLTDDQGWRIEIKKYPKLTTVGGKRSGSLIGKQVTEDGSPNAYDKKEESGFYTQAQIKDVVKYARGLGILVMPEIEMPGHSKAAVAAYPWLGCTQKPTAVGQRWGVYDDVFCAGREKTFEFMSDVLKEVCALFPSKYIHIGGDEVVYKNWKACTQCQSRMQKEGMKKVEELQSYFVRRIQKEVLNKLNKRMFGWDELVDDGLDTSAIIMSWRGTEGGIRAAGMGHDAVMTPGSHCYFDHGQSKSKFEPLNIGGNNPSMKVLGFSPVSADMSNEAKQHILGAQANCWAEYITDFKHVSYMVLPRMIALGEVLCNDGRTTYEQFYSSTQNEFDVLEKANYNFRLLEPPGFNKDSIALADAKKYEWQVAADNKIFYGFSDNRASFKAYNNGQDLLNEVKANGVKPLYFYIERKGQKSFMFQQNFK